MKCPVCSVALVMSERSGVEIDYCPECRGVWLDRGELDKIIEKSNVAEPVRRTERYDEAPRVSYSEESRDRGHQEENSRNYSEQGYPKKKKKEGFLGDLFDFGD
ncbi:MAG: zf-TFIIB domain-containing protein [Candidatus Berkelbacteria bacterium]